MAHPKHAITGSIIIFTSEIKFHKIFYIFIQLSMFLMFNSKFPENHSNLLEFIYVITSSSVNYSFKLTC